MKYNVYSVCHNHLLFYYFKCWQLVVAWVGHYQANIYKKLKKLGAYNDIDELHYIGCFKKSFTNSITITIEFVKLFLKHPVYIYMYQNF
jgi:hypothetical protein